jgi:hypothetical protein
MKDIELKIVTNQGNAITGIKALADETKKLYDFSTQGSGKLAGAMEQEQVVLKKLQDMRKQASADDLKYYNQAIDGSQKRVKAYNEEGKAVDDVKKSSDSLLTSVGKWAAGFVSAAAALKIVKDIIASTQSATHAFEVVTAEATAGLGFFFKAIASGDWTNFNKGISAAIKGARDYTNALEDLQNRNNEQKISSAKTEKQIAILREGTFDKSIENNATLVKNLTEIIALEKDDYKLQAKNAADLYDASLKNAAAQNKIDKDKLDNLITEYTKNKDIIALGEKYNELQQRLKMAQTSQAGFLHVPDLMNEIAALGKEGEAAGKLAMSFSEVPMKLRTSLAELKANAIALEAQAEIGSRRDENQLAMYSNRKKTAEIKDAKEVAKEKLKLEEDYQKAVNALIDKYNSLGIESKTGVDKLKAIRNAALEEIDNIKTHLTNANLLAGLGPITENQQNMILKMVDDVQQVYIRGMEKAAKVTPEQKDAISKALLSGITTMPGLQPSKTEILINKNPPTIWSLLGIDPDTAEGKKEEAAIKKAVSTTTKALDDIYKAKVEDATRLAELAQTKVTDAESALNTEIELSKAGYASNVDAKKKELETLKLQRDQAQKDEMEAVKKERALQAIEQGVNIFTSATNLLKSFSKIPIVGVVLAATAITAMFALLASAKSKSSGITMLAEGGRGEVIGMRHSQGGERFLDHVEVEQGERWGVLSRTASRKYGNSFYKMVDSFNRDALPVPKGVVNNILLDTSMTNDRLDELIHLNKKEKKEETIIMKGMTIIKKGSSVRIIKH